MELGACLDRVRERRPLIHCITNYVTANDVANLLLACRASPIMADEPEGSGGDHGPVRRTVPQLGNTQPAHHPQPDAGRGSRPGSWAAQWCWTR